MILGLAHTDVLHCPNIDSRMGSPLDGSSVLILISEWAHQMVRVSINVDSGICSSDVFVCLNIDSGMGSYLSG